MSTEQEVDQLERGLRFVRWHKDGAAPPCHQKVSPEGSARVDRHNDVRMLLPGVFFIETTFAPVGWDPDSGNFDGVRKYRNCQYMTPETRSTSHFFGTTCETFATTKVRCRFRCATANSQPDSLAKLDRPVQPVLQWANGCGPRRLNEAFH